MIHCIYLIVDYVLQVLGFFVEYNRQKAKYKTEANRKEPDTSGSNLNIFVESNNHNHHITWCVQLRLLMAGHCVG